MENISDTLSNRFWTHHFPDLIGGRLTEREALDTGFWNQLQGALETADPDTLWSIVLNNLPLQVELIGMHMRIKRTAKQIWHKKTD